LNLLQQLPALLRLASPAFPVGSFSYSQALEQAVDQRIVTNEATAFIWVSQGYQYFFSRCELMTYCLQHQALTQNEQTTFVKRDQVFLASRETKEILAETEQMGWSALQVLAAQTSTNASLPWVATVLALKPISFVSAMAALGVAHGLDPALGATAFSYGWIDAQIAAAAKSIPLGQSAVQRLLIALTGLIEAQVAQALVAPEQQIENFSPMLAVLSAQHETLYTRIFRS
jgi:urease accessory protein